MAIAQIGNHVAHLGENVARNFAPLALTLFAIQVLDNMPKANALGHFWKAANEDCYYQCKDHHDWKGLACFAACITNRHCK